MSRRGFLGRAGTAAAVASTAGVLGGVTLDACSSPALGAEDLGPAGRQVRADRALALRVTAAKNRRAHPLPAHPANGDDALYPNHIGSFCKCLPHNARGEVDPAAIGILQDRAGLYSEDFHGFSLTAFDGTPITI